MRLGVGHRLRHVASRYFCRYRCHRPRLSIIDLLIKLLHIVGVGGFWQHHDLLMRVAMVPGYELGRRLIAIHGTAPLTLGIVRVGSHHSVELLPLDIRHPCHLLVELLGPFLLVLDYFLARVAVHIRLGVADGHGFLLSR